jgi:phenylacetate 2-hydroxylase
MVSAGLDTVPTNLIQGIAYLATPKGQRFQEAAFAALLEAYRDPVRAWTAVLDEEKVSFVSAFVKETLRYFTVIAMCLPRASIKPIQYKGAVIPAGTLFYMNARGADFDSERFSDPYVFDPNRYLAEKVRTINL